MKIEQAIYEMMTENTGTHFLDSGGSNGRMWQRNQTKTIEDFKNESEVTMELYSDGGAIVNASLFHYLTSVLEVDGLCQEFNSMPCEDWDSEEFYGTSQDAENWILERFEPQGESFNSYNWDCPLSQIVQGRELECNVSGDRYVLLQIHGGADVRGGYTDAKLFKVECEYFLDVGGFFEDVDFTGEWTDHEGKSVDQDFFLELAKKHEIEDGDSKVIEGSLYYCGM